MPKKRILVLLLILFVVFGSSMLIAEEEPESEMCVPMGIIVLKPPESVEAKRSAVEFPHSDHFVHYDCKTCHHKWEGKSEIKSCTTSGCHDLDKTPEQSPGKKIDGNYAARYYKKAFHGQCIDCHKKILVKNKEMENSVTAGLIKPEIVIPGPTSCIKCHPK
ncbi:MAG: cytochrome c3 family protein [Desulfobacterales bacterium]|jgi:hypothetical protein|nr:cytochrome c3 family protein [Desulfobacterales bacterium]